jgi:hypothetical protein
MGVVKLIRQGANIPNLRNLNLARWLSNLAPPRQAVYATPQYFEGAAGSFLDANLIASLADALAFMPKSLIT